MVVNPSLVVGFLNQQSAEKARAEQLAAAERERKDRLEQIRWEQQKASDDRKFESEEKRKDRVLAKSEAKEERMFMFSMEDMRSQRAKEERRDEAKALDKKLQADKNANFINNMFGVGMKLLEKVG